MVDANLGGARPNVSTLVRPQGFHQTEGSITMPIRVLLAPRPVGCLATLGRVPERPRVRASPETHLPAVGQERPRFPDLQAGSPSEEHTPELQSPSNHVC